MGGTKVVCCTCEAYSPMGKKDDDWGWCLRCNYDDGHNELYHELSPLPEDCKRLEVSPNFLCVLWKGMKE